MACCYDGIGGARGTLVGRPDAEGHRAPSGTAEVMLRQDLGSRSNSGLPSAEMGTEVTRGRYPGRKGATESQHRSQGEPSCQEELAETSQSRVGGVKVEGKAVNCWLRNAGGRGSLGGGPRCPGSPALVENVIFTQPHAPTDPSPSPALPQLFVLTLWFSFLTLLLETLGGKGKKARMSQRDGVGRG